MIHYYDGLKNESIFDDSLQRPLVIYRTVCGRILKRMDGLPYTRSWHSVTCKQCLKHKPDNLPPITILDILRVSFSS